MKTVSSTKMDVCVPSPDFSTFSTSSPSSIYDHDRSHHRTCCGSSIFSNLDSVISDDIYGLDDNMEDGSLENFLTPDIMNSFNQITTVNSSPEFSWAGKLEHDVSMPAVSDSLSPNPTLAQIDMEPDMSFVDDMIYVDHDNKPNFNTLDFLCSDTADFAIQPCFNNVSNSSPASALGFVPSSTDFSRCSETASILNDTSFDLKSSTDAGNNFITAGVSFESNFPPRTSQPQLIGVAAVIKSELKESSAAEEANDDLKKLKAQSPNLHKLLSNKHPLSEIKSVFSKDTNAFQDEESATMSQTDICAQIVPSSSATKRTHDGIIKTEPLSPKAVSRSVIKEETIEEKWKDIEHFLHSPGGLSPKKIKRCDSLSSGHHSDDDDDDDNYSSVYGDKGDYYDSDDDYSDIDADLAHISPSECESLVSTGKKQKQFFWQYNVQSKGPKGTRLKLSVESPTDPHVLNDFEDPVFDECNTAIAGIRHGGKARKGDGNEITPNPRKLFMIGHQLLRLNRQINACQLGNDVPAAKRNESRKEKNKLASRACRLKKKAQHEANKIKLYGLEQEHSQLNSVLQFIWPHIQEKTKVILGQTDKTALSSTSATLTSMLESQIEDNLKNMIAGHTTEYVNSVIIKVESGDNCGGLNLRKNRKT